MTAPNTLGHLMTTPSTSSILASQTACSLRLEGVLSRVLQVSVFLHFCSDFANESRRALKPGGWIEDQEFDLMAFSDDNTLPSDSAVVKWCKLMNEGGLKAGLDLRLTNEKNKSAMEEAGLKEITVLDLKLPIGVWPADPRLREAGKYAWEPSFMGCKAFL